MDFKEKSKGRKRVFDIIQLGSRYDTVSKAFDIILIVMIFTNLTILVLDTFDAFDRYSGIVNVIELITVVFFTAEYILRVWTADYLYPNMARPKAVIRFMLSFYGIVDLMTILPYYLPLFLPVGFVAFRVLRVFRVFRLFRVNAQYDAFNVVTEVLIRKRQQLFSSIMMILVMMLASSIMMYSIEHEAQPDVFENAFSGIWWSVSTLLTVGYGDIYPVTTLGKAMSIVITFLGVGLVAIPTGIISAGFVEQYQTMRTFSETSGGSDLHFIMITLEDDHPWTAKKIMDITLPPELIMVTIIRDSNIVIPRGNVKLKVNDKVVLGALEFEDEIGIALREFSITQNHPWRDKLVKDLDIDKNVVLVSVVRHEKAIIPRGDLQIRLGDMVTVCDKHA